MSVGLWLPNFAVGTWAMESKMQAWRLPPNNKGFVGRDQPRQVISVTRTHARKHHTVAPTQHKLQQIVALFPFLLYTVVIYPTQMFPKSADAPKPELRTVLWDRDSSICAHLSRTRQDAVGGTCTCPLSPKRFKFCAAGPSSNTFQVSLIYFEFRLSKPRQPSVSVVWRSDLLI